MATKILSNNTRAYRPLEVDRLGCKDYVRRVMGTVIEGFHIVRTLFSAKKLVMGDSGKYLW